MPTIFTRKDEVDVSAVALDLDGTLRDTGYKAYEIFCRVVQELGGTTPSYINFVEQYVPDGSFYRECGVHTSTKVVVQTFRKYQSTEIPSPFSDAKRFLLQMEHKGIKTFVITTSRQERSVDWLKKHQLYEHLSHVQCESTQKFACLHVTCRKLGINPSTTLYVGDMGDDMRAANKVFAHPVGITRGFNASETLYRCGAELVVETLDELNEKILFPSP